MKGGRETALGALTAVALLFPALAVADAGPGVGFVITGPGARHVRPPMQELLGEHAPVVGHDATRGALEAAGVSLLPDELTPVGFAGKAGEALAAAAAQLGVRWLAVGAMHEARGTLKPLRLVLIDVSRRVTLLDGDWAVLSVRGRKRRRRFSVDLRELASALQQAVAAQPASQPTTADGPAPREGAQNWLLSQPKPLKAPSSRAQIPAGIRGVLPRDPHGRHAGSVFNVRAITRLLGRSFVYSDPLSTNLREFDSGLVFAFGGEGEVYPLRWSTSGGQLRHLGIEARFAHGIPQNIGIADLPGESLQHTWSQWRVGPKMRFDFPLILVGIGLSYAETRSVFAGTQGLLIASDLPSTHYQGVRLGLDARLELTILSLFAEAGVSLLLSKGRVGDVMFPQSNAGSLDIRLGVSRHLFKGIEVLAAAAYNHVYYDHQPVPGDQFVAGGSLDMYFGAVFGVGYVF